MDYYDQNAGYVEDDDEEEDNNEADFKKDSLDLLHSSIKESIDPETMAMEYNGLRLSFHATFSECI